MTKVDAKFASDSRGAKTWYWFGRNLCVLFCRVYLRMSVEGLENIPASGPFVLAPVHRSNMDTPIAAVCTKRRMRYMGKDSLWKTKAFGWLLSVLGGFPVSRDIADREALERCVEVLQGGEPLVLFPEGERKSGPLVEPLKDGAVYIAAKAQVPIVPVGIGGSEGVMPKGSKMIFPKKVFVVVGAPIAPPVLGEAGRLSKPVRRELSEQLHSELQRLFDIAQAKADR